MNLKETIRVIEDFPIDGISFKDITTMLKNKDALKFAVDEIAKFADGATLVAGPEARGFIFATAVAYKLGIGFVPIRKPGKLPGEVASYEYELEYGSDCLQVHKDAITKGSKVLIVDDLLATGGTLLATAKLIESLGGEVTAIVTLIELTGLNGGEKLKEYNLHSLVKYEY